MGAVITIPLTVIVGLFSTRPSDVVIWCKWLVSFFFIEAHKWRTKKRFDLYDMEANNDPEKVGFIFPNVEHNLESPYPESHLQTGSDEVFCYGVNSKSECLVVRVARACNQEAEAWIYLKLKNGKIYQLQRTSSYQQACCDKKAFTCGGLQMYYINPMRAWRIFFNGLLRETSDDDSTTDRIVHVKFSLLWHASSDLFDFTSDVNSSALAMGLARAKWSKFRPPLKNLYSALDFYAQAGIIDGTVSIDGNPEEEIYLFGERMRFIGDISLTKKAEFYHVLGQITRNGSIIHLSKASISNIVEDLSFGFIVFPDGKIEVVTDTDMVLENLCNEPNEDNDIKAIFHASEFTFNLKANMVGKQSHFESKKGWEGSLTIDCLNVELNSLKGCGVVIDGKILGAPQKKIAASPSTTKAPSVIPYVVHFSDKICQIPEVTGGKGSSLGKLTHLSKDLQNFIVPNGVVVTTSAYQTFLTKDILKEVKKLEDVLYGKSNGDVKEACQRIMDEVNRTHIPEGVLQAIVKNLQKIYGDKAQSQKFAVRSSATGEDTEQMSAAGQMETFLGVTNFSEIMSSVKKCWASQFSHIAVQYKRQYGQIINSPMAVVIQEMVPCDVAGVLFTCDPLTGNPSIMSITANYGLGESVVSGSEEPDTIELQRDIHDNLTVKSKLIGAKSRRIIMQDKEGTSTEDIPAKERETCCLSDNMALRLGNLAIKIERSYRSARDIEWGFWNNNLYIFQSRPVTSGTGETDFEIDHEKDGPLRTENDYFCVCNVGEVLPGAMTPLGMEVTMKFFNIIFQRKTFISWQAKFNPTYFPKGMVTMLNHVMFYTVDFFRNINEEKATIDAAMIGLFGRVLEDEELFQTARERYGHNKSGYRLLKMYQLVKSLYIPGGRLQKGLKAYIGYRIPVEKYKTSLELFNALMNTCTDNCEAMLCHMLCSHASSIWNMLILNILRKARGDLNADVYRDFSQLLATISDVESADVPSAMQSLAFHISKSIDAERFKKMQVEEAISWLKTSPSSAGVKFREFLEKHGHRCLKEFDVRSSTWGENPKSLVQILQNLAGNVCEDKVAKKEEDFDKMISGLGIPLGFSSRMMLKFLLPRTRSAVQNREASKSLLVKGIHAWRKVYWHLAKLMVHEGRIPDEDVLFFMTLPEIKELLETRTPKIISRANHRRRRYPELDGYIFPEIMKGFPIPVNKDTTPIQPTGDNFMMKGIPVSQGVAKGFVRVALTLEEASKLQPGEILLTYSTDIGWTPYFPALSGVVTELGGLISHGAVVSREYGLPCIAGLHGATRQFQTGDYVLLDGNKGILQKLPAPEDSV